jgi:hypothetical protein
MSDADHANVYRIHEALDAYAAIDWNGMRAHMDGQILWHVTAITALSGTYVGAVRALEYLHRQEGIVRP